MASLTLLSALLISLPITSAWTAGNAPSCPPGQLSCHNTTAVDNTCCFNTPGGSLLQTQFWDTDPVTGPSDSWTLHGLWPDNCDGTYDSYCDSTREYTNITDILTYYGATDTLNYMQTYWVADEGSNEVFWEHEWGKHGTCISTLSPSCYTNYTAGLEVPDFFTTTVTLFQNLTTYTFLSAAGITPSSTTSYALSDITAALSNARGGYTATVECDKNGNLEQVYYYFNVQGSVQTGTFVASNAIGSDAAGNCPDTVMYLPKSSSSSGSAGSGSDEL